MVEKQTFSHGGKVHKEIIVEDLEDQRVTILVWRKNEGMEAVFDYEKV